MQRPNILFIMTDQQRWDAIGLVSEWMKTPAINWIGRTGRLFTSAITNSPECVPARMSLATGLYPHQTGSWRNGGCTLAPSFPTWMAAVRAAGYHTSVFGKTHLHAPTGKDLRAGEHLLKAYGFDFADEVPGPKQVATVGSNIRDLWRERGLLEKYARKRGRRPTVAPWPLDPDLYYDTYIGQRAAGFLRRAEHASPWFCWVGFAGPHEPYDAPEPYASMYDDIDMPVPVPRMAHWEETKGPLKKVFRDTRYSPGLSDQEVAALRRNYAGNVSLIDAQISDVVASVEGRGELENTLIVFASDHGEMNGDQGLVLKGQCLDPAIRVPMLIRPPGGSSGARPTTANIELMDVGATIADYAGAVLPSDSNARSLRSLVEGTTAAHREFAVTEFKRHITIVDERWKVEFGPEGNATLVIDRIGDPAEQRNLAREGQVMRVVDQYRERLATFRSRTLPLNPSPVIATDDAGTLVELPAHAPPIRAVDTVRQP